MSRRVLIVLALASCSSKKPPEPAHTPAGPKPCEQMADHVMGLMTTTDASGKPIEREPQTADAITNLLIERCTKDKWTVDAQQCFLRLASFEEIDKQCAPLLTVEQREGLVQAIDQMFPRTGSAGSATGSGS
ncbi:MAG TPA: hypothetical protein VFQ53_18745 [Kofleriaceae bacterium]|nr:hypothetical protein [Kofleriaceae bacterium]